MKNQPNRRNFLLGSAAAVSFQLSAAPDREIRTAFIGVGVRGGNVLRQALAVENVKVAAVCDIDGQTRDKALSVAARDNPRSMTEWKAVVDLKDVEAVVIATPCDLHAEMASAALEAGKYVYCEKPLGVTPEQVAAVVQAARRSKTFLQIGQQLRYFPTMREAIRLIQQEKIVGQSFVIRAQRDGGGSRPRAVEETPQQKTRRNWYADVKRSGDLIVENAVHNLDACNWIADSRPVSAYGHGKKYLPAAIPAGTVMMDGFSVEYIYENDIHLDYSQLSFHPRQFKDVPGGMWYVVLGETGSVFLTHSSATFYDLYGEAAPRDMISPATREFVESLKRKGFGEGDYAVSDFYACIRENRKPFADIRVAATAALTAIMGREAIYRRRSVTWKELGVEL